MQYARGLLIGRFQPLHFGHIHLIHESLTHIDRIIIGIGSAQKKQIHADENPYTYDLRKKMLELMIQHENMKEQIESVIPLNDDPNDDVWRTHVLAQTGPIDVVVTNNDWVTGIFESVGTPTLSIPLYKRHLYEGKRIRETLSQPHAWQQYMPEYVWEILSYGTISVRKNVTQT